MSEIAQLARDFFDYRDGKLFWLKSTAQSVKVGTRAGCLESKGYRIIQLKGKQYKEHRLIYLLFNPDWDISDNSQEIDHIDRNKEDNRIENLRLVTRQENQFNRNARGYSWCKQNKKWRALIYINGKKKHLGYFDYKTDARLAYVTAKKKYHIIEERTHG